MERPSHIIFDTQSHYFSHRLPLIGVALSLQFVAFWLFTHALTRQWIHLPPGVIEVERIQEQQPPRNPPPEPTFQKRIELPPTQPPIISVDTGETRSSITTAPIVPTNPPTGASVSDRAPVSITSTHTVPPYPPIARRIGAEGKVTLRLTVSAEGGISQADIVHSSGRGDLDQAAQQWIVAHWTYTPALTNGVPAVSHVLATVTFSLTNEH